MATKQTVPVAQTEQVTTVVPAAEHAAKAGFTNWATIFVIAFYEREELLLITADGDEDYLTLGEARTEQVLASYEAVYTSDPRVPPHPRITVIAEATS